MSINFIEVRTKIPDPRVKALKKQLLGYKNITEISVSDIYTIEKKLTKNDLEKIAKLLVNPVIEEASINETKLPPNTDWIIEIGFLPKVTDNVANTVKECMEDFLHHHNPSRDDKNTNFFSNNANNEGVYSIFALYVSGILNESEAKKIGNELMNPLIQRISVQSRKQYEKNGSMAKNVPQMSFQNHVKIDEIDMNLNNESLKKLGKQGIPNKDGSRRGPLALDLEQLKTIQTHFKKLGRKPRDIELESLAQTWSEHCKHTIFSSELDEIKEGLYKRYIKGATERIREQKNTPQDICVSVFKDNAGAIIFDDEYLITHKVETHNTPSALDPFGGAVTGILGVNRDTIGFGMGAKPIANFYGYCFADPNDTKPLYKSPNKTQKMLEPKRIMMGVIGGVTKGGNDSGIPTPLGFMYFDPRYKGKPLVFVGTVGIIPKIINRKPSHEKKARPGDYIVVVGGRVGKDGIHGATFSSEALDSGSPVTAVQIGDPITQKKFSDALVKEARDLGLYTSITDNGAGGLSCSVCEMAKESGGCHVILEKIPTKYPNLSPWEIWISESQERMTLSVPKNKWPAFENLMKRRAVEASVIGEFTDSGKCVIENDKKLIMDLELNFLHDGCPKKILKSAPYNVNTFSSKNNEIKLSEHNVFETKYPQSQSTASKKNTSKSSQAEILKNSQSIKKQFDWTNQLLQMLARLNLTSYEFVSRQYDHEVQSTDILKPLQGRGRVNASASVIKPLYNSQKGIILSYGINPLYSDIDTYHMAACAIDTAVRNAVATGANLNHLALLDNFCWCSSNDPERLGQLKEAARACYDYAVAYGTPFISGKDSMFNDFNGFDENGNPVKISISPTLLISSIGVIDNIENAVSLDVKMPGDLIYILGETSDELGGSEYMNFMNEKNQKQFFTNTPENASNSIEKHIQNSLENFIQNEIKINVPKVNAKTNKKLYEAYNHAIQKNLIASAQSVGLGGLAVALAKKAIAGQLGMDISFKNIPTRKNAKECKNPSTDKNFSALLDNSNETLSDMTLLFSESQGRIIVSIAPENKKSFEKIFKGFPFAPIGVVCENAEFTIEGKNGTKILETNVNALTKNYRKTFCQY
ncbi:phosphoribosylformylglycinamidine synthase subunit PurS [Candidatus Peregrinibacteria bacterium]|nr:phosphoribosylformylglycinamidine synthase subunit PurS [Candidatus Peregrinibacteria bacterium]